jgi:HAD superfamily hydrolase (TIGR01484 family)
MQMTPLAEAPRATLRAVHTILTDLDDTLTLNGRLPAAAYDALERLEAAGLRLIVVTGRSAGWADLIARIWPVAGVIGENGGVAFRRDGARLQRFHAGDEAARATLMSIAKRILMAVPGSALASDQPFRLFDVAIDHGEEVAKLPPEAVARIVALFKEAGAKASASSCHVNGWLGDYDKLTAARRFLAEGFGVALEAEAPRILFIGDSPNDAPLFEGLPLTVGVANLKRFVPQLKVLPTYLTKAEGGAGFTEMAEAILMARL